MQRPHLNDLGDVKLAGLLRGDVDSGRAIRIHAILFFKMMQFANKCFAHQHTWMTSLHSDCALARVAVMRCSRLGPLSLKHAGLALGAQP